MDCTLALIDVEMVKWKGSLHFSLCYVHASLHVVAVDMGLLLVLLALFLVLSGSPAYHSSLLGPPYQQRAVGLHQATTFGQHF